MTIRRLVPEDTTAVAQLRRFALTDAPLAFGASVDDDPGQDEEAVSASLRDEQNYAIWGAFDGELVGMVGMVRGRGEKRRHKVLVWGTFISPSHRRQGLARQLMQRAIDASTSWSGVSIMQLSVNEHAHAARTLYESLGFQLWGTEPQALVHDSQRYSEHHLYLKLG